MTDGRCKEAGDDNLSVRLIDNVENIRVGACQAIAKAEVGAAVGIKPSNPSAQSILGGGKIAGDQDFAIRLQSKRIDLGVHARTDDEGVIQIARAGKSD